MDNAIASPAHAPPHSSKSNPSLRTLLDAHRKVHDPSKLPAFRLSDLKRTIAPPREYRPSAPVTKAVAAKQGRNQGLFVSKANTNPPDRPATTKASATSPAGPEPILPSSSIPLVSQLHYTTSRLLERRERRAPASHSSQGIETLTGPPPALSTQRSFAADPPRVTDTSSTSEWLRAQAQEEDTTAVHDQQELPTALPPQPPRSIVGSDTRNIGPRSPRGASKSLDETKLSTSRSQIPPIRAFRASKAHASLGLDMNHRMATRYTSDSEDQESDKDRTLRALTGYLGDESRYDSAAPSTRNASNRTDTSTGDLFLDMARDDMTREANNEGEMLDRTERRRSRIALASNRQSLPPGSSTFEQSAFAQVPRRGSDLPDSLRHDRPSSKESAHPSNRPTSRDRPPPVTAHLFGSFDSSRFTTPRPLPATPRGTGNYIENPSFDNQVAHSRRGSLSERSTVDRSNGIPYRSHSYRHSTLSQSMSRNNTYNPAPLVVRTVDNTSDGLETPRAEEGTNSTASTTAPSTVWDELDNLKSRIHRLELTGKMPSTSGAAVNHATDNRPPTATTTNTTMSTSPKRIRNISTSPVEATEKGLPTNEAHPLLHSALAKTKAILPNEVYSALYSTASDALAVASMMGSIGTPGPISSAQSVIGSVPGATDRQLRRKADSMCRSLTELCLALSEMPSSGTSNSGARPGSKGQESTAPEAPLTQQQLQAPNVTGDTLSEMKPSPRTLSRLQARRSSLIANSTLPTPQSPRYVFTAGPDHVAPSPGSTPGRRTSLLVRSKRVATDQQDEDGTILRAPSRAFTEIGQIGRSNILRASTRNYSEEPPLPVLQTQRLIDRNSDRDAVMPSIERDQEEVKASPAQSGLPIRRRYISSNINGASSPLASPTTPNTNMSIVSGLTPQRRFLQRATPDRDVSSLAGRMEEARGQRQGSLDYQGRTLPRVGSLITRRTMPITDGSTAAHVS